MNRRRQSFLVLPLLLLLLLMPLGRTDAASLGQWTPTTDYPIKVAGDTCVTYADEVYCVGGFDASGKDYANTYYAPLSPTGIGSWSAGTPYPAKIDGAACVTEAAEVYCIGGENSTSVLSNVYMTSVSPSGLGAWSPAVAYPQTIAGESCVVYSGYVYCVGGFNMDGEGTSSTYYASISSGIHSWSSTTPYPIDMYTVPCVLQANYIYCIAGEEEGSANPNIPIDQVYYAPLSPSGIGKWTSSTAYPYYLSSASCLAYSADIYCTGGYNINEISNSSSYLGAASPSGAGPWVATTPYPIPFDISSCVSDFSNVYCIAGRSYGPSGLSMLDSDYYAPLGVSGPVSTTSPTTTTSTSAVPEFAGAVALPLVLVASLLAVALLGLRKPPNTER